MTGSLVLEIDSRVDTVACDGLACGGNAMYKKGPVNYCGSHAVSKGWVSARDLDRRISDFPLGDAVAPKRPPVCVFPTRKEVREALQKRQEASDVESLSTNKEAVSILKDVAAHLLNEYRGEGWSLEMSFDPVSDETRGVVERTIERQGWTSEWIQRKDQTSKLVWVLMVY